MASMKKTTSVGRITEEVTRTVKNHPGTAAVAGLAAATALGATAWIRRRRRAKADGMEFHVEPDGDGAWRLRQEGADEPIQRHDTKRSAVSAARSHARAHSPSVLTIHNQMEGVTRRHLYTGE